MTDLIVTKQPIDSSKAIFEMSARTATTGSAILVKEAGAWKVEDEIGLSLCQSPRAAADVASRVSKAFRTG